LDFWLRTGMTTDIGFHQEATMYTFGRIPRFKTKDRFDTGLSEDKRALTLTFADFHAAVGGSNPPGSLATRLISLVLPLHGEAEKLEIEFTFQGFVFALEGASASLVCSVNGQTTVSDFPAGSDQDYLHKHTFTAERGSEARLYLLLLVGRDSKNTDAEAHMNVATIDAEILPRPS
jgi:hypothetical protein